MAYTTPPTFVSGDTLLASELNVLSDDIVYLAGGVDAATFSAVQLRRAASQAIATSTDTYISWDTENIDAGGWWSSGTTITVPSGAIPSGYTTVGIAVFIAVKFATNGTGKRSISIEKNGSSFGSWKTTALDDDVTTIVFPEMTTVASGDTIKLSVWQNSGGSLNVTEARISIYRIGAAS